MGLDEMINNEMIISKLKWNALHFAAILITAALILLFGCCGRSYAAGTISSAEDLKDAFANGGEYYLTADVQRDEGLTLNSGKELDIDLVGHTITIGVEQTDSYGTQVYPKSNVIDGGRLTLRDSLGSGKFERNNLGVSFNVINGGELVVDGAIVTGHDGVRVSGSGSKLTMNSGEIGSYMGIDVEEGASMKMIGGILDSSRSIGCYSGSFVSIQGGEIQGGDLTVAGENSIVRIYSGTIKGMLIQQDKGTIDIRGGTITGLFLLFGNDATLSITGGKIAGKNDRMFSILDSVKNNTIDIRGGYYRTDPSEWLKDVYVAADSNRYDGYPYEVIMLEAPTVSAEPYSASPYDSIDLHWNDNVRGARNYKVYMSTDGVNFPDETPYIGKDSFLFRNLDTGTKYYFRVTSVGFREGIEVESIPSPVVSATPVFNGSTALTASNSGSGYSLTWDAVDGAISYEVWRGPGASGTRKRIADAGSTSYTDSSADIYTTYNYTVKPKRTVGGNSFYADESNVVVPKAKDKPQPAITPPKKDDPAGTGFGLLQARATKVTNTSVKIGWKKVPGAKKYIIYGNKCGSKNAYKKLTTTTNLTVNYTKVAGKKVKKGTYYKFIVYAVDAKGKVKSTSKTVHVASTGGKVGNDKKVTTAAKKGKVTLKKGKTFKLKAKAVPASKKLKVNRHRGMAYETSNKKVATVTSKGVIKGAGKGTCYIYAYTQNGVFAKVKVTVK